MITLSVSLPHHVYPIYIGSDIFTDLNMLPLHIHGQQIFIVTQETIARHYLPLLLKQLQHYQCDIFYLPEGESFKNSQEWQKIMDRLMQKKHERSTTLIALGGGVVGDITGFAAACYQRGVHYIQIPTTLIAQVDSAIGGKTGINHPLGKNMIGAFHQPQCVIADIHLLSTLSQREFISGLAEVIKYGLIADESFFLWLETNMPPILQRDPEKLLYLVSESASIKANIVQADERDHELRNLLNFGHTFGHALETLLAYQGILHGEAVAIGMMMAATLSAELQFISLDEVERIRRLLLASGLLQFSLKSFSQEDFLNLLAHDKKIVNQQFHFIVLKKLGEAVKVSGVTEQQITNVILSAVR